MSYSFYVKSPGFRIPFRDVLAMLREDFPEYALQEPEEIAGPLEDTYEAIHGFLPTVSTRNLEIAYTAGGDLQFRVMFCASPQDYAISVWAAAECARRFKTTVSTEENDLPCPPDALQSDWSEEECLAQGGRDFRLLRTMVAEDGKTMTIAGPQRPFFAGPKVLGAIDDADLFFQVFRRQQWLDAVSDVHASKTIVATTNSGKEIAFTAFGASVPSLMSPLPYVAVVRSTDHSKEGGTFFLPFGELPQLIENIEFLDEETIFVPAVPANDWPEFVARAERRAVTPLEDGPI
jgi:hypothetical protein